MELFLSDLRKQCKQHGIALKFVRAKQVEVEKGIRCTAWFDHLQKEIVIARKSTLWLSNLVHESCHLDQFLEQSEIWKKEEKFGTQIFDRWLLGKKVYSIRKSINNLILLELDCEKRAIAKIVKYDLPINTVTYVQRANEILLYYRYLYETQGEWSNDSFDGYQKFPKRFLSDSYYRKKLSDKVKKIFIDQGL